MNLDKTINCLVVDDMLVARKSVVKNLKSLGFENIVQAADGAEAFDYFEEAVEKGKAFGLILADLNMPKLNGIELLQKIRSYSCYNDTPVMIITAETEDAFVVKAVEAGANNYITKPFDLEELEHKINNIFENLRG